MSGKGRFLSLYWMDSFKGYEGNCVRCIDTCIYSFSNHYYFNWTISWFVQGAFPLQTSTTVRALERLVLNACRLVSVSGAVPMCTSSKRKKDDWEGYCVHYRATHSPITPWWTEGYFFRGKRVCRSEWNIRFSSGVVSAKTTAPL